MALIEETAETEPPGDAPPAPPDDPDSNEELGEVILLPSQRGCKQSRLGSLYRLRVSFSLSSSFLALGRKECTPDELAATCKEIQESSRLVKSHTYHLIIYKNSFVGRELVDWMVSRKDMCRLHEWMDG